MRRILIWMIRVYQHSFSLVFASRCRFYPSCSHYCAEAIETFGLGKGLMMGAKRLARCHPFNAGGFDYVGEY
jgi:putative membrane protein insertion efficiency factor